MHISTRADVSPALSIEQSVMVSGRGRGRVRSRDRDFEGHGSFGGGRDSYGSKHIAGDKAPR